MRRDVLEIRGGQRSVGHRQSWERRLTFGHDLMKDIHEVRIKLRVGSTFDHVERLVDRHGRLAIAARSQVIKILCQAHDARQTRNAVTL